MQTDNQKKPVRLTKADWEKLSSEWKAGKLNQPEFCKLKGIKLSTFVYWRQKLSQEKKQKQFLPVRANPLPIKQHEREAVMLKLPNGISLQIASNTDKTFLKTLFELLGITSC